MEVIFLDSRTLAVLDNAYASSFNLIIDNVVPQSSSFTLSKESIKAVIGDYLVIRNAPVNYIGIITSIDSDEHVVQLKTKDFISILDIKVKLTSYSGNLSIYLTNLIRAQYINNVDNLQNLPYLTLSRDANDVNGSLTFEDDTIDSISSVVTTLNKAYYIGLSYSLIYEFGVIKGIDLRIGKCTRGLKLKSSLSIITNMIISHNDSQTINKITFYPKKENSTYTSVVTYYLLTDGTLTTSSNSSKRIMSINQTARTYSDNDYSSLYTTAQKEMLSSSLEHSITFDYLVNNKITTLNVGDYIDFITPSKTYSTMITKITFKDSLSQANITLGEYRISLTEKLKLLERRT